MSTIAIADSIRTHGPRGSLGALAIGALGGVYGDIGTSPLYTLKTAIDWGGGALHFRTDTTQGDFSSYAEVMSCTAAGNVTIAGTFSDASDRNAKEGFEPVEGQAVLAKVAALPIQRWRYKAQAGVKHLGPMAQDFHAAFGLNGPDDTHITTVDEEGVALAAIQGLNQKLAEKEAEIRNLKEKADQMDSLEKQLKELEAAVKALAEKK